MSAQLEKIVNTYKRLTQIPALTSAKLQSNAGIINSVWTQRNVERGKNSKFLQTCVLSLKNFDKVTETLPLDVSNELLVNISPSEKYRAVLREIESKQYLEIWQNNNLTRNVDLSTLDVHGGVYTDGEFTSFEWSPNESKLLYVAEKKVPKSEPFYKRKSPKKDQNSGDEASTKGEEYLFKQDWGEQLVGKKQSVIVQYDVQNDMVDILEGVPEDRFPAQPVYAPDGSYIVGVSYKNDPRKLGLMFCTNRVNALFKLDFQGNYEEFTPEDYSVRSPRFTPDGKVLIWLQRKIGGPHAACLTLVKTSVPVSKNPEINIVVDIVHTEEKTVNGLPFYGIYNATLLRRCWASNGRLLLSTNQKYAIKTYVIDIDSGKVTDLEYQSGSQVVLDVYNDYILVNRRNFLVSDKLAIASLPPKGDEASIQWTELTMPAEIEGFDSLTYHYLDLTAPEVTDDFRTFNAMYVGPKGGAEKEVPLIVFPHGGPHSAFGNYLFLECALFTSLGYAVLLVNYRGSIGAGQNSVEFLLGRIGKSDVADCIQATQQAFSQYPWLDSNRTVLVGGSHGGFLVTHLSGQYPDMFKAVVARNPVIDVASMTIISDIPDWSYAELRSEYTQIGEPDSEIFLKMRKASPIQHAHKVKAPTLLQIGSKDLRVPSAQATEYYHRLKANGVNVRMNLYDDNHPLSLVPNEMDNLINSVLWIEQHLSASK